jgi:hypothetical protein
MTFVATAPMQLPSPNPIPAYLIGICIRRRFRRLLRVLSRGKRAGKIWHAWHREAPVPIVNRTKICKEHEDDKVSSSET